MNIWPIRTLLLLTTMTLGLQAQLDTRLQQSQTDVLDVYTGSNAVSAPPEILTLIDNSQSMCGVYWSRYYYANADSTNQNSQTGQSWHNNPWGIGAGDFNNRLVPVVYLSGTSAANVLVWVNLHLSGGGTNTSIGSVVSGLQNGLLIKPNGDPVQVADVATWNDPKLWVQRASHVRFSFYSVNAAKTYTYTLTNGTTNTYPVGNINIKPRPYSAGAYLGSAAAITTNDNIRVVDIPLPWAVFDVGITTDENLRTLAHNTAPVWPAAAYTQAKSNHHPQHYLVYDPVPDATGAATSAAQYYDVDSVWSQGYGVTDGIMLAWTSGQPANAKGKIGYMHYNADYLAWVAFGKDVRNQAGAGTYINGMVDTYTGSNDGGYSVMDARYTTDGGDGGAAWNNSLPNMTRVQAVKRCVLETWVANQRTVNWATRFLYGDNGTSSYSSANGGSAGQRKALKFAQATDSSAPDTNLQFIMTTYPVSDTPLVAAVMNAYGQIANSANSLFPANPATCTQSFLIIMSDGAPTDSGNGDPYSTGITNGNTTVNAAGASDIKGGTDCNIYTLAAVAAHYSGSTASAPTDSNSPKIAVPWLITDRPTGTTRRISTMTIGVCLEGVLTDTYGAKKGMYSAALYGWEKNNNPWNIKAGDVGYNPPASFDPTNPLANDKTKNPFFFDANDPDKLSSALYTAVAQARTATDTMGAPVAPLVGLSVGKQTYIGTFVTNQTGIWSGDLLMAGLSVSGSSISILDQQGTALAATTGLNAGNAAWSAAHSIANIVGGWQARKIYTLTPGSSGTFTNTLLAWNESLSTTTVPNSMLNVPDDVTRRSLIRYVMGASASAQADPAATTSIASFRSDLMGDIINSTPLVMEFPLSKVPSGGLLATFVSDVGPSLANTRFRLIIVGDNQGLLHGFGEVSGIPTTTGTTAGGRAIVTGVVEGQVDELWAFLPPDLLSGLQAWRNGSVHRYLVDGSPTLYLYENGTPNGLIDGTDYVRILFGLGKGGRSYYCLTFTGNDPAQPSIAWKIRPDEIGPTDVSSPNVSLKTMGFSSSTPTLARILDGTTLKDVFLIGGGLTTIDVDTAFSAATNASPPGYGSGTTLGRSVLALSVTDGSVVKVWDFVNNSALKTAFPSMGCIPASVTPVEAIANSFSTQRVYFTDGSGGAYVLGATSSSGSRTDTNALSSWSVRHLYTPKNTGTAVSVPPVVFSMPYGYPVTRTTAPTATVPCFGVIFGSGDRNDPLDFDTVNPGGGGTSYGNRLVMILDRQDSADITGVLGKVDTFGYRDDDLADLSPITSASGTAVDPSNASYYLKTKSGYVLNFNTGQARTPVPAKTYQQYVYQKEVTPPLVLNKVLFFTTFQPSLSSGACNGAGISNTYVMTDVINPVFSGGTQSIDASHSSGIYIQFNDIPSALASVGLAGVLQAGEVRNGSTGSGTIGTAPISGRPPSNMVKPRGWRIIR